MEHILIEIFTRHGVLGAICVVLGVTIYRLWVAKEQLNQKFLDFVVNKTETMTQSINDITRAIDKLSDKINEGKRK